MAVSRNNQGQAGQPAQQAPLGSGQPQAQQAAPQYQSSGSPLDFMDLLGTGSALLSPRSDSEVLNKVSTAITETIKRLKGGSMPKDWHVINIDHASTNSPASIVAIVAVRRDATSVNAFVTNLLLDAARVQLSPTSAQLNNRQLQITTTLGQVFDANVWGSVRRFIASQLGLQEQSVQESSAIILPKDYDLEYPESLTNLAYLATVASAIDAAGGAKTRLRLPELQAAMKSTNQFVTRIDFTGLPRKDLLGRPVRSDVVVQTMLSTQADQNAAYRNEKQLVELSAYVEMNYIDPQPMPAPYAGGQPVIGTQVYAPEIVITNCASGFQDFDLGRALFCLVSAGALDKGGVWARTFLPRRSAKKSINLRNIGAIGYELAETEGKEINTERDVFEAKHLEALLLRYFHQLPLISIDIDPNAAFNWVMNAFIHAGNGDVNAKQQIINAANELTGNAFSKYFDPQHQICQTRHVLAGGTYIDADGEVRDLEEIDYLAALNLFGNVDKDLFKQWSRTFEDQNMSTIERLAEREALLRGRLSGVEITHYKHRVTFDKAFLAALENAMVECGYRPTPDNVQSIYSGTVVRGSADLLKLAQGQFGNSMYAAKTPNAGNPAGLNFNTRYSYFGS